MSRALWHVAADRSELLPATAPPGDSVAVQARYSMISTGTERLVATGRVPAGLDETMGVPYMEGGFELPVKYGYSLVGETADGRRVHCMHPHQETAWVAPENLFVLPQDLPLRRAALISNTETALNAAWDARLDRGGAVAVCGFGSVGALVAMTLRVGFSVEPLVVELDADRRERAGKLGFATRDPGEDAADLAVAFNASGSDRGLQWCIDHGGLEARIVDLGWYGDGVSELRLGGRFHYLRQRIVSSQVSHIPQARRADTTLEGRKRHVVDLLSDAAYDDLIDGEVPFAETPAFFDRLRRGEAGDGLIRLVRYEET